MCGVIYAGKDDRKCQDIVLDSLEGGVVPVGSTRQEKPTARSGWRSLMRTAKRQSGDVKVRP